MDKNKRWGENETCLEHKVSLGSSWECMRCGKPVFNGKEGETIDGVLPNYCGHCGREVVSAVIGSGAAANISDIRWDVDEKTSNPKPDINALFDRVIEIFQEMREGLKKRLK